VAPDSRPPEKRATARAAVPQGAPEDDGFDIGAVERAIDADLGGEAGPQKVRAAAVARLKDALAEGRAGIEAMLAKDPRAARRAARAQALLIDRVVETAFRVASLRLHPLPNPTDGERLALLAVGGYGRGELAP